MHKQLGAEYMVALCNKIWCTKILLPFRLQVPKTFRTRGFVTTPTSLKGRNSEPSDHARHLNNLGLQKRRVSSLSCLRLFTGTSTSSRVAGGNRIKHNSDHKPRVEHGASTLLEGDHHLIQLPLTNAQFCIVTLASPCSPTLSS